MNLNCETILDFYTHKNRTVLCQINVTPESRKFRHTRRCLSKDEWMIFDKELEKLLTAKECWSGSTGLTFNIKPYIEVKVKKSKISLKRFYKCLGAIGDSQKSNITAAIESSLVLECLIDFHAEIPFIQTIDPQEYHPQIKTSSDPNLYNPLPYEPYTPSKKILGVEKFDIINNTGIDFPEHNEEIYTPKPILEVDTIEPLLNKEIPKYTPAPINARRSSKEKHKSNQDSLINKPKLKINSMISSTDERKSLRTNSKRSSKNLECEYIPKSQDVAIVDVPIYIPTPIEETTSTKDLKADNIRKHKKRSNTIDVFPEAFDENNMKEQISKLEQHYSNKIIEHNQCCNKKFKKRSMTIDEIPVALTDFPIYTPTPIEKATFQNINKANNYRKKKEVSNTVKVFSKLFDENINENYTSKSHQVGRKKPKNKKSEKHNMSIDEIQSAIDGSEDKFKSFENETNEKGFKKIDKIMLPVMIPDNRLATYSSSECESTAGLVKNSKKPLKTQKIGYNNESNDNNKQLKKGILNSLVANAIQKSYIRKERKMSTNIHYPLIIDNESVTSTALENVNVRIDRKVEEKGPLRINSLRRSIRSPSKPKRLIDEQPNRFNKNKCKKPKPSPKNKELFGTDDDDEDDCFENNKLNASVFENFFSLLEKKKHKNDQSSENQREKHNMTKRVPTATTSKIIKNYPKSVSPISVALKFHPHEEKRKSRS